MGTEMNLSTDLGEPKPRYEYYAGLTSAPGGCCNEPMEFLKIAPARTSVAQRVLYMEGYNIWDGKGSLAQRAGNFSLLEEAAMCLGPVLMRRGRTGGHELGPLHRNDP
jgi:hypothetical protein